MWNFSEIAKFARYIELSTNILRFCSNKNGGIATAFAMALVPILMAAGIAVDYGFMYREKTFLQSRADAAAIAGAREMSLANVTKEQIVSAVEASAYQSSGGRNGTPFSVAVDVDLTNNQLKISLVEEWEPFLAQLFHSAITPIVATAVTRSTGQKLCLLALNNRNNAIVYMRSRARLTTNDCGVISNSNSSSSIRLDDRAELKATFICTAGGIKSKSSAIDPSPVTDCPVFPDPLANRAAPSFGGCNYYRKTIDDDEVRLSPGVYCGGLTIRDDAEVYFKPGIYIIKDGKFRVTDESTVRGKNVGFYFTGSGATLDFSKETSISLTAPNSGPMAGLLFFEDRDVGGNTHRITSDDARTLLGTIYFPNSSLLIDANRPVADRSAYTAIIVDNIRLEAGPVLTLNSNYGATNIPVPQGISNAQGYGSKLVFVK